MVDLGGELLANEDVCTFLGLDSLPAMEHGCLPTASHVQSRVRRSSTAGLQDKPGRAIACLSVDVFLPSFLPVTV